VGEGSHHGQWDDMCASVRVCLRGFELVGVPGEGGVQGRLATELAKVLRLTLKCCSQVLLLA